MFSFAANVGGLLGLSMGCSIISIAELFIFPVRRFLCPRKKKRKTEGKSLSSVGASDTDEQNMAA